MLRYALHEFQADIVLTAVSPLLVKDGRLNDESRERLKGDRKKIPMAIPVSRNTWDEVAKAVTDEIDPRTKVEHLDFYIPGSSMKGSWRSHLERTLRGLTSEEDTRVCDPLDDEKVDIDTRQVGRCSACSAVLEKKKAQYSKVKAMLPAYAMSCPVCRMFGNTTLASRVKISDGVRSAAGRLIQREHVAINRKNGQVMRGPLKFFALQDTKFTVTITLRNYELQQLLLISILLSDLGAKRIPLGSGKSKGYGEVKAEIQRLKITTFSLDKPGRFLTGLGEHPGFGEALKEQYRWKASELPEFAGPKFDGVDWKQDETAPWRWNLGLKADQLFALIQGIKLDWKRVPNLDQRLDWEPEKAPAWPQ